MRLLAFAFLLLSSCATIGTVQRADTLGAGNSQFAIEPAWYGAMATEGGAGFLHMGLSGRFGISDTFDLGARVGSTGIEMTTKFLLSDPAGGGTVLSIAPSGGGLVAAAEGESGGALFIQVPLLIGIPVGEGSQFILGPKVHDWIVFGTGSGESAKVNVFSLGSSFGYSALINPHFSLLPEFSFVYPLVGSASMSGVGSDSDVGADGILYQITLGIILGSQGQFANP